MYVTHILRHFRHANNVILALAHMPGVQRQQKSANNNLCLLFHFIAIDRSATFNSNKSANSICIIRPFTFEFTFPCFSFPRCVCVCCYFLCLFFFFFLKCVCSRQHKSIFLLCVQQRRMERWCEVGSAAERTHIVKSTFEK